VLGSCSSWTTMETGVFSLWSVPRSYLDDWDDTVTRVEASSNTSTVALLIVGGDKKGSLKFETVKYGREAQRTRTRTRERLLDKGQQHIQKTDRPLVREGAPPKKQNRNSQTVKNIWSWAPDGARHQDLLTDWPSVAIWLWLGLDSVSYEFKVNLWRED
jgi:hypothetical protein